MIENPKRYTARDLETIFFRPMFKGESAEQLGIRVIYNMPMPTVVPLWSPRSNVLQPFTTGWTGGESAIRQQKIIDMSKIKAEVGFSAEDYFNQIYELITNRSDVNLEDLVFVVCTGQGHFFPISIGKIGFLGSFQVAYM